MYIIMKFQVPVTLILLNNSGKEHLLQNEESKCCSSCALNLSLMRYFRLMERTKSGMAELKFLCTSLLLIKIFRVMERTNGQMDYHYHYHYFYYMSCFTRIKSSNTLWLSLRRCSVLLSRVSRSGILWLSAFNVLFSSVWNFSVAVKQRISCILVTAAMSCLRSGVKRNVSTKKKYPK